MISAKISTNSESLSKFGRSRRMGWRNPVEIPTNIQMIPELSDQELLETANKFEKEYPQTSSTT